MNLYLFSVQSLDRNINKVCLLLIAKQLHQVKEYAAIVLVGKFLVRLITIVSKYHSINQRRELRDIYFNRSSLQLQLERHYRFRFFFFMSNKTVKILIVRLFSSKKTDRGLLCRLN